MKIYRRPLIVTTGTATSGAIAVSRSALDQERLLGISLALNTAPTTGEDFTITLNANSGTTYDVLLYSLDLSTESVTDLVYIPDDQVILVAGDSVDVAYTNTDGRTYGVEIRTEPV